MTWVNDREVMQYFAARQQRISEPDERAYLETLVASKSDRAFSVFRGEADPAEDYVGQCSINQIYWPARNGRIFLAVRSEMHGQGYGRAALAALVEHAFGPLGLHKLWLIVRRDNLRAQAMYLRAGFEFEGVLRDEYAIGDRFFDMVRMARVDASSAWRWHTRDPRGARPSARKRRRDHRVRARRSRKAPLLMDLGQQRCRASNSIVQFEHGANARLSDRRIPDSRRRSAR